MTAASGVLHKEFHESEWSKTGGEFQMVQLWVNLPAKDKMSAPKYQALSNKDITKVELPNQAGFVEVIAGEFEGQKGSASTFSQMNIYNLKLNSGAEIDLNLAADFNTALLVIEGKVIINQTEIVNTNHLALMANDGEKIQIEASENSVVLVLSGQPLNEPIASHGPFVMNTREELNQAFLDYNNGKFGRLD
jgi:hypothetical protein